MIGQALTPEQREAIRRRQVTITPARTATAYPPLSTETSRYSNGPTDAPPRVPHIKPYPATPNPYEELAEARGKLLQTAEAERIRLEKELAACRRERRAIEREIAKKGEA